MSFVQRDCQLFPLWDFGFGFGLSEKERLTPLSCPSPLPPLHLTQKIRRAAGSLLGCQICDCYLTIQLVEVGHSITHSVLDQSSNLDFWMAVK